MNRSGTAAAIAAAACALVATAPAAVAQQRGSHAAPKPFFDSRDAERRAVERRGEGSLRRPGEATRRARRGLDAAAHLEVDPLTGTPRVLGRADRPLSSAEP